MPTMQARSLKPPIVATLYRKILAVAEPRGNLQRWRECRIVLEPRQDLFSLMLDCTHGVVAGAPPGSQAPPHRDRHFSSARATHPVANSTTSRLSRSCAGPRN